MEKAYYLGLDQGTTGETALLLDRDMRVVARGYHEHRQFFPKPGWVEHVPQEILDSLLKAAEQAMRNVDVCWEQSRSIGLANQGKTCLMWDRYTPLSCGRIAAPPLRRAHWRSSTGRTSSRAPD